MKTDQAFHDEKPFLQQISLIYSLPLTDVRKLLHSPLLKGSREVQVLSQQRIPNTHLPVSSYTPGSFPCQTRDRSGTGEINKQRRKLFSVPTSWRIATTFSTALRSEVGWAREVFPLITVYINIWKTPTSFLVFFFSFKFWEGYWEMKGGSTRIFEKPQQCFSTPFSFTSMGWFQTHLEGSRAPYLAILWKFTSPQRVQSGLSSVRHPVNTGTYVQVTCHLPEVTLAYNNGKVDAPVSFGHPLCAVTCQLLCLHCCFWALLPSASPPFSQALIDRFFKKEILLEKQPHKHLFTIQNLVSLTNNFPLAHSPTFTLPLL